MAERSKAPDSRKKVFLKKCGRSGPLGGRCYSDCVVSGLCRVRRGIIVTPALVGCVNLCTPLSNMNLSNSYISPHESINTATRVSEHRATTLWSLRQLTPAVELFIPSQRTGATVVWWLDYSPPTSANRVRFPAGPLPDFRHVGIAPNYDTGWRVFSGISRFPRHLHSGAAPYSPRFALIGSQDLDVKATQISSLLTREEKGANGGGDGGLTQSGLDRRADERREHVVATQRSPVGGRDLAQGGGRQLGERHKRR
ncbi:hypothetical protein PR048_019284 [Dryococelus australis]|uniref:Uncharacterized protein n=1 Tax=Dryococelus australis TaxID=614101 RepID=A0ABQ9H335_9NEOP|nr:hypothetical protein PR048_019284 [Dryococelus australis]